MHYRQITAVIATAFATAERLGATVPKPLAAEHAKLTELAAATRRMDIPADVPGAVLAALEAGNDPTSDPGVQAAVIGREISTSTNGIEDRLGQRVLEFVGDNVDALLSMFAGPFDKAADTLTQAAARLGDVNLDDTQAVLARGGDAARVWAEAQDAQRTIAGIMQAWKQLARVAGVTIDPRHKLLVLADVAPAAYLDERLNTADATLSPFELATRGHRLSLATPSVLRQRVEAVQAEVVRRSGNAAGDFGQEFRRARGVGVA